MWRSQSDAIAYSGDQTSGYKGGSEFFDINVEEVIKRYPSLQYLVFCNNVFSNLIFTKCMCKAGYMLRDAISSGEIFEPKTVTSSFLINCDSRFAYLFAIDVRSNEFVWLNIANDSQQSIAGTSSADFLKDILSSTQVLSVYDFVSMLATEVVHTPEEADVVFSDEKLTLRYGAEQIRSCDYEKILALLNL